MSRFRRLGQLTLSRLGVSNHQLGIELGSTSVRLISDGRFRVERPAFVLAHGESISVMTSSKHQSVAQSFRDLFSSRDHFVARPVIERGLISDSLAGQVLLKDLLSQLPEPPQFGHRYRGWCSIPSAATNLEREICQAALPNSPWITWQLMSKAELNLFALQALFKDSGMRTVLDIGAETTELTLQLGSSLTQSALQETIFWGTKDLERMLEVVIRDVYQVQLSTQAMNKLFSQLGDRLFEPDHLPKASFAVRAQSLATGRPVTVTIQAAQVQPAFLEWFSYLTTGLHVLLQRRFDDTYSTTLEQGMVVVGGGATIADVVPALATHFEVPTTTVPEPRMWIAKGLQLLTKPQ